MGYSLGIRFITLFMPKEMVPPLLLEGTNALIRCLAVASDENLEVSLKLSCVLDFKLDLIDGDIDPLR